jgi:hypothetical protein
MTLAARISIFALGSLVVGCAASTRPEIDAQVARDTSVDEPSFDFDVVSTDAASDALDDFATDSTDALPVFADGAECRTTPYYIGGADCQRVFEARGIQVLRGLDTFICCAGRCFIGSYCLAEDPTRARCDIAERTCNDDELCCQLRSSRYDCRPRSTHECRPVPDGF